MPCRTGKQIRDRYLNVLDSILNIEKFTKEEDNKIIELYIKKWKFLEVQKYQNI